MHPFYLVFVVCCVIFCDELMNDSCKQTWVACVAIDTGKYLGRVRWWMRNLFLDPSLVTAGEHLIMLLGCVIWKVHSLHDSFKEISNIFLQKGWCTERSSWAVLLPKALLYEPWPYDPMTVLVHSSTVDTIPGTVVNTTLWPLAVLQPHTWGLGS